LASEVKGWLGGQGFDNVFLDVDKETGIGAGKDWARELYQEISTSQAVVIIATENWSRSRWCFAEAQQAQALGKVIFPIVSTTDELNRLGPELGQTQATVWDATGKAKIASRLREIVEELARGYRWNGSRPPGRVLRQWSWRMPPSFLDVMIKSSGWRRNARRSGS
jgi:hypothetical protein